MGRGEHSFWSPPTPGPFAFWAGTLQLQREAFLWAFCCCLLHLCHFEAVYSQLFTHRPSAHNAHTSHTVSPTPPSPHLRSSSLFKSEPGGVHHLPERWMSPQNKCSLHSPHCSFCCCLCRRWTCESTPPAPFLSARLQAGRESPDSFYESICREPQFLRGAHAQNLPDVENTNLQKALLQPRSSSADPPSWAGFIHGCSLCSKGWTHPPSQKLRPPPSLLAGMHHWSCHFLP